MLGTVLTFAALALLAGGKLASLKKTSPTDGYTYAVSGLSSGAFKLLLIHVYATTNDQKQTMRSRSVLKFRVQPLLPVVLIIALRTD